MLTLDGQAAQAVRDTAQACLKSVVMDRESGRHWVMLNFPRRTSVTLYMGFDIEAAGLIYKTAEKVVVETMEYQLASQRENLAAAPHSVPALRCLLKQGVFERWFIVHTENQLLAWSGSQWVSVTAACTAGDVQACNFGSQEAAAEYAREFGFEIGGEL
jgi:hypothetical protein